MTTPEEPTPEQSPSTSHIGEFTIPYTMIQSQPDLIMSMMAKCIPLNVIRSGELTMCYTAISPDFESITDGGDIPHYEPVFSDLTTFTGFRKIEEGGDE